MPSPVLQFKRGAFANLPGLRAGEPALTTDSFDLYVGIDSTTNNNKFFGSHRYWKRETSTVGSGINLVEGTSNGSSYIQLKSPDSLVGVTTYTFPATPTDGYFLKTNTAGDLSWAQVVSDFTISADTGTPDTVSTGSTITFVGGTNVNTAVTDQTITINLDSGISLADVNASGIITAAEYYVQGTKVLSNPGSLTLSGIQTVDATTKATLEAILGAEPNTFTNLFVSGISTFQGAIDANGGATIDNIQIGVTNDNKIDTVAGVLELDSAAGKVVVQDNVEIYGNLDITGNVSVGGTAFTITTSDLYVTSRDIVVGYTTTQLPNDNTANHGGIAIASTEGTPLVSFSLSGINTLPDTYKQMMWFQSGALGFQEDMFAFNYGVAVGTTVAPLGTRLAVGTGITMSDTAIKANTFYGSLSGNATSADTVKTVTAGDAQGTYHITFVPDHNGSPTAETVYTDDGIYYNPGANKLTTQHAEFTGNVLVSGITTLAGNVNLGDSGSDLITVTGIATFPTSNVYINNSLYVGGLQVTGGASIGLDVTTRNLLVSGISTIGDSGTDTLTVNATTTFAQPIVGTISTATNATNATNASFINITAETSDDNVYYVPFEAGIGNTSLYIDTALSYNPGQNKLTTTNIEATRIVLSEGVNATGIITASSFIGNLTGNVTGTASTATRATTVDVTGTATNQNFNLAFTDGSGTSKVVNVDSELVYNPNTNVLSVPTVNVTNLKANDGTAALTISNSTGAVTASNNLTVNGDLYVNGNTTQINTTELTVYDRTATLGVQTGTTPTTTTWDLGVMMNYGDAGVAKTAGVIWKYSTERFVFSANSDNPASGSNTTTPVITVGTYAPIEIGSLWVNDCAGQSQVISCTGNERFLENITVDAGTF